MELIPGRIYIVKHSSGFIRARFICERVREAHSYGLGTFKTRSTRHFLFENLATHRDIEKSIGKVRRVSEEQ